MIFKYYKRDIGIMVMMVRLLTIITIINLLPSSYERKYTQRSANHPEFDNLSVYVKIYMIPCLVKPENINGILNIKYIEKQ